MFPIDWQFHAAMFSRLLLAASLGSLIGYERERAGKPADVRTPGMVALGADLFGPRPESSIARDDVK